MLRFRLLGSLDLRREDGTEVRSVLAQPKRLAFLAYLAIAQPGPFHRRDALTSLFWPESDAARARGSLRQTLYFLRKCLAEEDVLLSRGEEEVALRPGALWSDAVAFQQAFASSDWEEALALYRGDLLEGFHIRGCPELERWIEFQRAGLRESAVEAAWARAHQILNTGELPVAMQPAKRALSLSCTDETHIRSFVQALADTGDRAAALHFYRQFEVALEEELGLEPAPETRAVAESLISLGVATERNQGLSEGLDGSSPTPDPQADLLPLVWGGAEEAGGHHSASIPPRLRRMRTASVVGAAIVTVIVVLFSVLRSVGARSAGLPVVAVMPFQNFTGDPALDDIGQMACWVLTQALERTDFVAVRNADMALSSWDYVRNQVDGGKVSDPLTGFASEVDAGIIVHGVYSLSSGQLRVRTSITDVIAGTSHPSPGPLGGDPDTPEAILDSLAGRVLGAMAVEFHEGFTSFVDQIGSTPSWEASQEFLRGIRLYLVERRWAEAVTTFLRAHQMDRDFFSPLIYALQAQVNVDETPEVIAVRNSILAALGEAEPKLTPYERTMWKSFQVLKDWPRRLRYLEEACEMIPGSKACFNLAKGLYASANDPRKALEVFTSSGLRPDRGWMRGWSPYWVQFGQAAHLAGMHQLELDLARAGREHDPERLIFLDQTVWALAGLGRVEEAMAFLVDSFPALGMERMEGEDYGSSLYAAGTVLEAHGFDKAAAHAYELAREWWVPRLEQDPENVARHNQVAMCNYLLGRLDEAEEHWKVAAQLQPSSFSWRAGLGAVAAKRGDQLAARRAVESIDSIRQGSEETYLSLKWKAFVADAMGERTKAFAYLRAARAPPVSAAFHLLDPRAQPLRSLRGYPPYEELMWPEGRAVY